MTALYSLVSHRALHTFYIHNDKGKPILFTQTTGRCTFLFFVHAAPHVARYKPHLNRTQGFRRAAVQESDITVTGPPIVFTYSFTDKVDVSTRQLSVSAIGWSLNIITLSLSVQRQSH